MLHRHPLPPLTAHYMRICKCASNRRKFTLDLIFQGDISRVICVWKNASFSFVRRQAAWSWPCQVLVSIIHEKCCSWDLLGSAQSGKEEKVASFQLALLNYSIESTALAWLQFYLSNECTEIADITLCCKSNLVLIDSTGFTQAHGMASCTVRAHCGVICIWKDGHLLGVIS